MPFGVPCRAYPQAAAARRLRGGTQDRDRAEGDLRRRFLHRDPGSRAARAKKDHPALIAARQGAGYPARRHERRPLYPQGRLGNAGCAHVHPDEKDGRRSQAHEVRYAGILPEIRAGDGRTVFLCPRGDLEHARRRAEMRGGALLRPQRQRRPDQGQIADPRLHAGGRLRSQRLSDKTDVGGAEAPLRRDHGGSQKARRLRAWHHPRDGIRGILSDRHGFYPVVQGARDPGRPRARERRGEHRRLRHRHHGYRSAQIRPILRALPESRPRDHARLRRRFL